MRHRCMLAVALAAVALITVGCGKRAAAAAPEDVLVLDVGGEQPSLRAALLTLGRSVAPPHSFVRPPSGGQGEVPSQDRSMESGPDREGAAGAVPDGTDLGPAVDDSSASQPEPVDPAPPLPLWTTVKLGDGETLIHVARRHLGDGRRFHELLEWNGWSERDARVLRVGQPVRIKTAELR